MGKGSRVGSLKKEEKKMKSGGKREVFRERFGEKKWKNSGRRAGKKERKIREMNTRFGYGAS